MQHTCGICGQTYVFEYHKGEQLPSDFPFCSARCKAVDLQKWLNEEYKFSTDFPHMEFMTADEEEVFTQFSFDTEEADEVSDEDE